MLWRMERAPTALHRVAAWCAAALALALVLGGTRSAIRLLVPEREPEPPAVERAEAQLADVDDPRPHAHAEAAPANTSAPPDRSSGLARRPVWAPGQEPMEKHPALVIEGRVLSASGSMRSSVHLAVEHPTGGTATTQLCFDRPTSDGRGTMAPFKLIKPALGAYTLRPVVESRFEYAIEPREWRVEGSTDDIVFVVRDDVLHVDLDVVLLGAAGEELPRGRLHWRVFRGTELRIDDLLHGGLTEMELEAGTGPDLRRVPVTNALEFLVTADGCRPLRAVLQPSAGERRLEVRMQPGWGFFLVDMGVRTLRSRAEAAEGEILVDGRRVGTTDPSGVTFVAVDGIPREFAVLFHGRRAKLLRKLPKDRLVVTIDQTLLEDEGYVPRPARD